METKAPPLICPQGHGPGVPGAGFCTACGTQLVPPKPPIQQTAALPGAADVPWTPVATAPAAPAAANVAWQPVAATPTSPAAANVPWAPLASAPAAPAATNVPWSPMTATPAAPAAANTPAAVPWAPVATASAVPAVPNSTAAPAPYSGGAVMTSAAQAAQAAQVAVAGFVKSTPTVCTVCGGTGTGLKAEEVVCASCSWLRPLLPGYQLDRSVFLWAGDGKAMATLQAMPPLHAVVKAVSDKVGRPWIESTFNAIRLGPKQLPDVWKQAVLAARILGLPKMPDVYISGDQMWNTYTYGTETSSFIVLGTSHLINFANDEMLFVLAREMGHCRAGHALWKTVTRFLAGDISVQHGLLSDGLLNAISPTKLIHGALDLPLMAWARQSEITADRAGLLAVGDEALARRVLLAWSVRSARLLQQVNIEEWMKQEEASDDQMTRFSEMTTSSSMYTTRRLRLLGQAAHEPELMRWSQGIQPVRRKLAPAPTQIAGLGVGTVRVAKAGAPVGAGSSPTVPAAPRVAGAGPAIAGAAPTDSIRAECNKCQTSVRIPLAVLKDKTSLNVRCPKCQNVFTMRRKPATPEAAAAGAGQSMAAQPAANAKPASGAPATAAAKPVPTPQAPAGAKPAIAAPAEGAKQQATVLPAIAGAKRAQSSPVHAGAKK